MDKFKDTVMIADGIEVGGAKPVLFAGPCAAESVEICSVVAGTVQEICADLGVSYVFKASFDKANRTSGSSYRGPENGLRKIGRAHV